MNEKKYPRVLVLSNMCFSESTNNGRTLGNFFKGWPHDKLAQFYIKDGDEPWEEVCENYYCFTDKQVLNILLHRNSVGKTTENNGQSVSSGVGKNAVTMTVRALLWRIVPWEKKGFSQLVDRFNPEAVVLQAGDTIFMYDLAYKISRSRNIPLYIYNSEDHVLREKNYFDNSTLGNIVYPFFHSWLKKSFWRAMKQTKSVIYISDKLCNTYNSIRKHDSHVIYTSTELKPCEQNQEHDPLIVSYFGNMDFDRDTSLIELSDSFSEADNRIKIDVYGKFPDAVRIRLEECNAIRVKGFVPYDILIDVIKNSDIVVHIESFNDYYQQFNDHYFSTKIADCLICGKPFLVYAPKKIAFVEYLIRNDAAIVITDPKELGSIVEKAVSCQEFRKSKVNNAITLANVNHKVEGNIKRFQDIIIYS